MRGELHWQLYLLMHEDVRIMDVYAMEKGAGSIISNVDVKVIRIIKS